MGDALSRLCDWAEGLFKATGVVLFAVTIGEISCEIVMRSLFDAPSFRTEPLARNAMIWTAWR